jgi:pyrimidine operon attenuation protein/uracil phosphoribosyltransferase
MTQSIPSLQVLMTEAEVARALTRIAREIAAANPPPAALVLAGIQTGGVHVARRLAEALREVGGPSVELGELDINMHRDDLDAHPAPPLHRTTMPLDLAGKDVLLVDDVLSSGRTVRAALDALHDLGRPRRIQLAVLVDRGQRKLPIKADFVGLTVSTTPTDKVDVQVTGTPAVFKVVLEKAAAP